MKIKFGDSIYSLTVGSFADETHRVSFFLEDEEKDFVIECTEDCPIDLLEENQIALNDAFVPCFIVNGLISWSVMVTGGYVICNLTRKALDFLKEYEARN
jgi:hypothetical protein